MSARRDAGRIELDGLLTESDFDELIEVDPYNREPSSRRSDKEIARVLDLLDNLPRGKGAE